MAYTPEFPEVEVSPIGLFGLWEAHSMFPEDDSWSPRLRHRCAVGFSRDHALRRMEKKARKHAEFLARVERVDLRPDDPEGGAS